MMEHPLLQKVNDALNGIRPYLIADGGNVQVLEITAENVVKIAFEGACVSCNMSAMTFKGGVEDAILKAVPDITKVEMTSSL
jgi:Fe-S cluster biogenesis protein NfuA